MDSISLIPVDLLIINGTVLTMDPEMRIIQSGAVAILGGKIVAVGETRVLESQFRPRQVLDAIGMLVIPGLINTHTHSGDSLFRGLVEDLSLENWLQKLWVAEARFLNAETIAWGARLAYIEMVHCGITTAVDMFWFPDTLAEAAKAVGFRLVTGTVYIDSVSTDGIETNKRAGLAGEFIRKYSGDDLITPCIQPHSVYTVPPEYLREAGALAKEYEVLLTTHASETSAEVFNCIQKYGLTPIKHLDKLGLLTARTLLAHCVHLMDDEFDLLSERGVSVAHCPLSNLKLASGIADVSRMMEAGVNVTIGTDGPVSGNDLNPWFNMRLAAILQKTAHNDPTLMATPQVIAMVTRDAARALGLDNRIGSVEPGKQADLTLIRTRLPHSVPGFDPYSLLVYTVGRENVDTVLINGRIILKAGKIVSIDENEVLDEVQKLGSQIQEFAAGSL
jgi:5-methylthioadenosine/S-adenosylhomocysteine deaminase